ncbi:Gfo/Idh/MocA family protein [Halomicrobium urmianum]|uniref:Gfo/Idh/MocA family protein n=1 Tax=Halomicrobium urmianum TaxID=1586233 RepID=UPI001CD996AF|nr:Gfo/Idh/MocA family oxidoreductase [Halomicrobium urmianum]
MAYRHAPGYRDDERCEIVACADLVEENRDAFAEEFNIDDEGVFEDYNQMLRDADPDIVSICTPVPTHAPIVMDCIQSGVLDAIHCEKPMATTWGDARLMAQEAGRRNVQLTFNHQRRFHPDWREPKQYVDEGEIGELQRLEVACGELLDNGTHFIDLANFYNDERATDWVIGGIDYRNEHLKYGAHNENHGMAMWEYENGVHGLITTGFGEEAVPATNRIIGTDGVIEVHPSGASGYRIRRAGESEWDVHNPETGYESSIAAGINHIVDCLENGAEPELSARRALDVTEIIFGAWESVRKRGRVEFPLRIDDNPLEEMVESGALSPTPADN